MRKQFVEAMVALSIIGCTISKVQDPKTGKQGYLEACGKDQSKKAYVGGFMKSYKQAIKQFKRYVQEHPDRPAQVVDYQELLREQHKK